MFRVVWLATVTSVVFVAGCGASERTDDDDEVPPIRTCDYRDAPNHAPTCVEWGPGRGTDGLRSACDELRGVWSHDACPPDDRVGCCSYEWNGTVRECFYAGATGDLAATCTENHGGTWVPG
jgi:hypothetical protein